MSVCVWTHKRVPSAVRLLTDSASPKEREVSGRAVQGVAEGPLCVHQAELQQCWRCPPASAPELPC